MNLERQKELTNKLDSASKLYYAGKETELTDVQFDLLFHELEALEAESGIRYPNSPTLRVGSDLVNEFKKIAHPIPMLTISNVYDDESLKAWIENIISVYGINKFNISVKYDGISCELHYKDGILIEASTRGDKNYGDDITNNVRTIKSIPLSIDVANDFYVRGEILFPRTQLYYINEERQKNGEKPFSNTRNACSGSVKQLDSRITAKRKLIFRAWDCFFTDDRNTIFENSLSKKFDFLENVGFYYENKTKPYLIAGSIDEIINSISNFHTSISLRSNINFDSDGIVLKIDDILVQDKIGIKDSRSIEWGIARKWNEEYASSTKILGVDFQVGRTGNITPVARLQPVSCNGVIVSNATLNNESYINKLNLHINDSVEIIRSGGVIPQVVSNISNSLDKSRGEKIKFPTTCPVCGSNLFKIGEIWKCSNDNCEAKIKGQMIQWCSKECMNIKTIGEKTIDDLYEHGFRSIFQMYDIISVNPIELSKFLGDGYGIKSIEKMQIALKESLKAPLDKIIFGLGIEGVGKLIAKDLAARFKHFDAIFSATYSDLLEIDGIGDTLAKAIYEFGNKTDINGQTKAQNWSVFLSAKGFIKDYEKVSEIPEKGLILEGMTIVFSGKSKYFDGDKVEEYYETNGAKTSHSITKKTNYLVIGDKPGNSKIEKANNIGVPIINEEDFMNKFFPLD